MPSIPEPGVDLASTPTPIDRLDTLSDRHDANLYVKRDDETAGIAQGNKVRKLEYLLGDALEQGAEAVVTTGGVQSNHCRATAVSARRLGLDPHLVLRGEEPTVPDGNLLLDRLVGADIEFVGEESGRNDLVEQRVSELADEGVSAYPIPSGGSNALGALAYVRAYEEIREQAADAGVEFDRIYVASGSGGTQAGLVAGALAAGDDVEIVGVDVTSAPTAELRARVEGVLDDLADAYDWLDFDLEEAHDRVELLTGFLGPGYAEPAPEHLETIVEAGRTEGLILDTCYTGKAFTGFLADTEPGETCLFVHTGGSYGAFPLREQLADALE